ncbi:MAG: glycerol-3-phosphate dehydrogenase [Legionella sp.]|nr:MAG: glycerol-3-phosphate dehydrogenase [Legionella sp.]
MSTKDSVAILGAGSWGTAVAIFLAEKGHPVLLWSKDHDHVQSMQAQQCNERYLPNICFPQQLTVSADLEDCVATATHVLIAVPSHAFATVLDKIKKPKHGLAWLTKGIDPKNHQLLSELVKEKWGESYPTAVISGPSFAKEVAAGLPTALVVASVHPDYQQAIRNLLHAPNMRVYVSDDINGVQLCGVVKNILAIACGISDGIGYGANAKAALITRGLAEMQRLLTTYNARIETCLGLAGVGDLVLTCTDNQSRNRRFGLLLGQGIEATQAEKTIGQVVEGKHNAAQVCALAKQHHIEMPICQEVEAVLSLKRSPQEAVSLLMSRPPKEE